MASAAQHLTFIFGIFGNIVSFVVFLAPVPTFYKIYQRKSSTGYQAIPYSVALFSASLLLFYAYLKTNAIMIVTINAVGCVIEAIYLGMHMFYATRDSKISTLKLIAGFNGGGAGLVMIVAFLVVHGPKRVTVVGWFCSIVNVAVFAAPLSIMRQVIVTRSVEFMPFFLSFCLTLCATSWFFYGFFLGDFFIAVPNVLGFLFGIAQMILYFMYKNEDRGNDKIYETTGKPNNNDIEMNMNTNTNTNHCAVHARNTTAAVGNESEA